MVLRSPFDSRAESRPRMGLPFQLSPLAARSLDCRAAHGDTQCVQRMFTARNRRHVPECIRRLIGLDDAVDNKAFGELISQARTPRADAPKGSIAQAQPCDPLCVFAIAVAAVSEDALMLW